MILLLRFHLNVVHLSFLFFSQRVMRRSDFCDVLLCLRDGGPGGDKPGGRLAGSEQRLDRLAHLPRAEGGGEIGRLAASLCSMWPDPDKLAKEKEDAPLPAGLCAVVHEAVNTWRGFLCQPAVVRLPCMAWHRALSCSLLKLATTACHASRLVAPLMELF